jgi:hypothetical protein
LTSIAISELTKQLAEQALGSVTAKPAAPVAAPPVENPAAVMLGQVQAMQKALKDEDELIVLAGSGTETVRVLECFAPSPNVLVLMGTDREKNAARLVAHVESLQLFCKVSKTAPGSKPVRIAFLAPRSKAD